MTNWLITGGCGFIGRNLIKHLNQSNGNISIKIIDNFSVGTPKDLDYTEKDYELITKGYNLWNEDIIQIVHGDIMDQKLALNVTKGADVIVHLAANTGVGPSVDNPRSDCLTNVIGTFNYLDAARINNCSKFIFASSGAPIGECTPPIHEELACHPVSPYGASKLAGEGYCSAFYRTYGVKTIALRFGNVYGPGSTHKSSVVAKFIKRALRGLELEIYGDGKQTRDFIYVEDLINSIQLSASIPDLGGEVFQIATNQETTVGEITNIIVKLLAENGFDKITIKHGLKRVGDVMRNFSDTSKAKEKLNWEVQNSLSTGLEKTIKWFLNQKKTI